MCDVCSGTATEEPVWETKDGRRLRVADMTDDHIQNTIAMLRRKGWNSMGDLDSFLMGGPHDSEMAEMYFFHELNDVKVTGWLDVFDAELRRRGQKERGV